MRTDDRDGVAMNSNQGEGAASRDRVIGVAAMLMAMAIMPVSDGLAKSLATSYAPEQVTWARNVVHAGIVLPFVLGVHGFAVLRQSINRMQLIRAGCFVLMTGFYVAGLKWTPLADAMATVFLFPFLVVIGSAFFLGEKVGMRRWCAVAVGFAGVLMVVRPGFGALSPGLPLILACAGFTAAYILLTRKLASSAPTLVMGLLPAVLGTLMLTPAVPFRWVTPDIADALVMLAVGVCAATGHLLIVVGYAKAEASFIVPLTYLQIICAAGMGYALFGDLPEPMTWVGIAVIAGSGIFIAMREKQKATGASGRR